TVLLVRVGAPGDSIVAPRPGVMTLIPRAISRFTGAWAKLVPWPISVLILGFILAVSFVLCAANDVRSWATFSFATAVIALAFGVVGLFIHTRRRETLPEPQTPTPTKASIYRQYPVRIDSSLADQWSTTAIQLKEQLEARDLDVDWPRYKSLAD